MMKLTPGPWERRGKSVYAQGVNCVADVGSLRDAQLISATPDLLEALECVEWRGVSYQCSFCSSSKENGHESYCLVGLALKKARKED